MPDILGFFISIWESIPKVLRLFIIIPVSLLLIYRIDNAIIRIILSLFSCFYFALDIAYPYFQKKFRQIKEYKKIKKEEIRIEKIISSSTKETSPKGYFKLYFPYNFKIENTSPKNKKSFIDTVTKTIILKENIKENKSENLTNFISFAITVGYLPQLWECFTPKLSELFVYEKIREILEKTEDMEAVKIFVSDYDLEKRELKEKDREAYHLLIIENSFYEIFLPLLFYLKSKNKPLSDKFRKEVENFFYWLSDKERRLKEISPTKYLPKVGYVYVKRIVTPLSAHEDRIITKFEKYNCVLCILGSFNDCIKFQNEVSDKLSKLYPVLKSFDGKSLDKENEEREARYIIHKNIKFYEDLTLDANSLKI